VLQLHLITVKPAATPPPPPPTGHPPVVHAAQHDRLAQDQPQGGKLSLSCTGAVPRSPASVDAGPKLCSCTSTPLLAPTFRVAQELPERVHFVWASRQPREFCLLDAELLEVATCALLPLHALGGLLCHAVVAAAAAGDSPGHGHHLAGNFCVPRRLIFGGTSITWCCLLAAAGPAAAG
jgi:hypothetical protein